jgi:hypothetical protein
MIFALTATVYIPYAYANFEPEGCTGSNQSLSLTWFRDDKITTVAGSNSPITGQMNKVDIGEELFVEALLSQPIDDKCNYFNGTLFVVTPDMVEHELSMQVPTITNTTSYTNFTGSYFVDVSHDSFSCRFDVESLNNSKINACGFYGEAFGAPAGAIGGLSHSSDEGEDPASAFNAVGVNFVIPPQWNATTLANVTGSQSDPVSNPLDVVTIEADSSFLGTFTGNFTLGNATNAFESGACTGGAVNATTGIATLDCQATGTYDTPVGDICFDVTVNAPSPYAPSIFTFFGADDSDNECFDVQDQVEWNATTLSNVTGIVGAFSGVVGDEVTINGVNGTFGNFTGNATLTFNSTETVVTTSCSSVSGDTFSLGLECAAEVEITEPGQYCWDVTITEFTGNYTPSVLNLFGIDDAENECFDVFQGLTPGFWKANAENWGANAWVEEDPETDYFNAVFGTSVELKIAKGKSDLDRGDKEDPTLYGALGARGGDENALARHCVAAKLNVENPDVEYPYNFTQVITQCGDALNSGNVTAINDLKDILDEWNNFGANISQHWPNN